MNYGTHGQNWWRRFVTRIKAPTDQIFIDGWWYKNDEIDKTQLYKAVRGALASCIDAHGPITKQHLYSATKRVVGAIRGIKDE